MIIQESQDNFYLVIKTMKRYFLCSNQISGKYKVSF
jgi:hypothetical protein